LSTPLKTHHEARDTYRAEQSANVVDLAQNMAGRVVFGEAGRVLVAEDDEKQADEVPDADEDAVVTPVAGLCDQLGIEYGRAEGQNGEHHQSDILGAVFDGHDFTSAGECDEFVETGAETREDASS
jgi:hypothetical protein